MAIDYVCFTGQQQQMTSNNPTIHMATREASCGVVWLKCTDKYGQEVMRCATVSAVLLLPFYDIHKSQLLCIYLICLHRLILSGLPREGEYDDHLLEFLIADINTNILVFGNACQCATYQR